MQEAEIAECLKHLCPLDAGTPERLDKHWDAANNFAASELVKNMDAYRARAAGSSERHALPWLLVNEGRRIRNDFLKGSPPND